MRTSTLVLAGLVLLALVVADSDALFLKKSKDRRLTPAEEAALENAYDSNNVEQNVFFDGFFKRFLRKKASMSRSDTQDEPEPEPAAADDDNNNDNDNNNGGDEDEDSSANQYGEYNSKAANEFLVPMGGKMVNICDQKYFNIATLAHDKIRDLWTAVCHGHSGASWLISKFAKGIKKPN